MVWATPERQTLLASRTLSPATRRVAGLTAHQRWRYWPANTVAGIHAVFGAMLRFLLIGGVEPQPEGLSRSLHRSRTCDRSGLADCSATELTSEANTSAAHPGSANPMPDRHQNRYSRPLAVFPLALSSFVPAWREDQDKNYIHLFLLAFSQRGKISGALQLDLIATIMIVINPLLSKSIR